MDDNSIDAYDLSYGCPLYIAYCGTLVVATFRLRKEGGPDGNFPLAARRKRRLQCGTGGGIVGMVDCQIM
ncbi:MAG: hypothetical protein MI865_06230, partial [Proteobacteria bacterium]|nr:hypothetical protein [Pseudomonadota bacterium]